MSASADTYVMKRKAPVSIDRMSADLVQLTRVCGDAGHELSGGILGGEHGYGPCLVENDVFVFKSYCWCDRDGCAWCGLCSCPPEAFEHYLDGTLIDQARYDDLWDRAFDDSPQAISELERRQYTAHAPSCDRCMETGIYARYGAQPGKDAPNFWHKESGIKVSFYKYIGRSMEATGPLEQWQQVIKQCVDYMRIIEGPS